MKLLHIDSSILGDASASRQLTREVVERFSATTAKVEVTYRDLSKDLTAHLSGATFAAKGTPADQRDTAQANEVALHAAMLAEFMAADVIVLGAPMYNFTIPTQLKSWIDQICVAGVSFRYTETGPEGLAKGKRVVIVATAGGMHAGKPTGMAHVEYLKVLLNFLGITEIKVVHAEGLSQGEEAKALAFSSARTEIARVIRLSEAVA